MLRCSAARREQQHQSDGDKKSACRDVVHLSLPDLVFLEIHATENTAAMSMLDYRHHPHKSVCLYRTSSASTLDAWLAV
jgi:hypothetical protein